MASCKIPWEIIGKIVCIVLLLLQGAVLDYYLVVEGSSSYLGFVATDIIVLIVWIVIVFIANTHFNVFMKRQYPRLPKMKFMWKKRHNRDEIDALERREFPDELPYAFVAWFAYTAITLVPEVAVIFKGYSERLEDVKVLHQNIIKVALCITPLLFLLLVSSHHNALPHSSRKCYMDKLTGGVTLDLMDSIDILDILFLNDYAIHLPEAFKDVIIAFACINFFLPTLALLELSVNKFDGQVRPVSFQVLYSLSYVLLVNMPFFIIRVMLWVVFNQDASVFIAKNIIMSIIYLMDIREALGPKKPKQCPECEKLFLPSYLEQHRKDNHGNERIAAATELQQI